MNKKGHIPTVLLLVPMLMLMIIAIATFNNFEADYAEKSAESLSLLEGIKFSEAYIDSTLTYSLGKFLEGNQGQENLQGFDLNFKRYVDSKDLRLDSGNFFGKVRNGEFTVTDTGDNYVLVIEGVFVKSKSGVSEMKKEFNITITFNQTGIIDKVYK